MSDIEKRFLATPEVEPDALDLEAINRIAAANDTEKGITLEEMRRLRTRESGKISLRIPMAAHKELVSS
ncbi:MAG: hypothetical protein LBE35_08850 [Clostridiales bacterium]|jgi:hypothetical protein|nr:hypothetical protein [Clostridiales bacterium]